MRSCARIGLIGLALSTTTLIAPGCLDQLTRESRPEPLPDDNGAEHLDIEALPAGTILSAPVYGTSGSGPIQITGLNPGIPTQNAAVIFDSATPTGGDVDLGTPNADFGGPGQGTGGQSASEYKNEFARGKLIIVDNSLLDAGGDGIVDDPNDGEVAGTAIELNFSAIGTVTATDITIVDVQPIEGGAGVALYAAGDLLLHSVEIPQVGDNGVATVSLGPTEGVRRMRVTLNGSGAIDDISFLPETPDEVGGSIGDFVWCDTDEDGVQDAEEPGIAGVTLRLYECGDCDSEPKPLATTDTDSSGTYLFDGLEAGCYRVVADPPDGRDPEDDCRCPTKIEVNLEAEQDYLDADFCFVVEEENGEGCSLGYWKNHHGSWVGYEPNDTVREVFANSSLYPSLCDAKLKDALRFHGGSGTLGAAQLLIRHGVAALLNASSPEVDYPRSVESVVSDVDAALLSEDRGTMLELKGELDADNNLGCPFDDDDDDDDD